MKLDICLQADMFNIFRNTIWDKFEVDCSKYITSCSLSLDLMLKCTGVKIQLFKDITMFDYVDSSILGGLCLASQNIADNDNDKSTISSCDVCSLYPYIMSQKLPISNYKFVKNFNKNKYGQNKNYSCLLNVEIYTTYISHLGYDKDSYISFEMYEMMKSLGYKINIKKYYNINIVIS